MQMGMKAGEIDVSFTMYNDDRLDHICNMIEQDGLERYEAPLPEILATLSKKLGGTFLDIGANNGVYSLLVAAANPAIKIHTFEPVVKMFKVLSQNIDQNPRLAGQIATHQIALADTDGTLKIQEHVNPHGLHPTSSSLRHLDEGSKMEHIEYDVEVRTLDRWADAFGASASFIKLDVEGFEREVLKGAASFMWKFRPALVIELLNGSDFGFFNAWLKDNKYKNYVINGYKWGMYRQDVAAFDSGGWNHFFVPDEKDADTRAMMPRLFVD